MYRARHSGGQLEKGELAKNLLTNLHVKLQSRVRSTEKGRTAGKSETDTTERILHTVAAHPTVKNVMLHTGPARSSSLEC